MVWHGMVDDGRRRDKVHREEACLRLVAARAVLGMGSQAGPRACVCVCVMQLCNPPVTIRPLEGLEGFAAGAGRLERHQAGLVGARTFGEAELRSLSSLTAVV
jgi:hypothetical protein